MCWENEGEFYERNNNPAAEEPDLAAAGKQIAVSYNAAYAVL